MLATLRRTHRLFVSEPLFLTGHRTSSPPVQSACVVWTLTERALAQGDRDVWEFFYLSGLKPLSLRELVTTVTELMAIAAAARTGFRKPCSPSTGTRKSGTPPPAHTG